MSLRYSFFIVITACDKRYKRLILHHLVVSLLMMVFFKNELKSSRLYLLSGDLYFFLEKLGLSKRIAPLKSFKSK